MSSQSFRAPRRGALIGLLVAGLSAIAAPVHASDSNNPGVASAQGAVNAAAAAARRANSVLGSAQDSLAASLAQLSAVQHQTAAAQAAEAGDKAQIAELAKQEKADRAALVEYVRDSYKTGSEPGIAYVLAGGSLTDVMERLVEEEHIRSQGSALVSQVMTAQQKAKAALADISVQVQRLSILQAQAAAAEAVLAVQEENAAVAAQAAHSTLAQSEASLRAAQALAAAATPPPPPPAPPGNGGNGVVYNPVQQPTFTADTDLTQPSHMTAGEINSFLSGTALAGLGQSYMNAETTYHVSARYLVAHSILESAWGTSAIAQDKHNLFGFGADDANPYGDAMTFPSFDACIQFVAHFVAVNYLSPSGPYYHGPTLRGMNVDYASDPLWADKIARIADTIP